MLDMASSSSTASASASSSSSPRARPSSTLARLPAELRLKIWSCGVEPRIVVLDDLIHRPRSYPLPPVTQLNAEARTESRPGYEPAGRGSHVHFARDILVCDPTIADLSSRAGPLAALAPRVRRLAFWDCFPDDGRVDGLRHYAAYLAARRPREPRGRLDFDKLWFPNLQLLWIVKVGHVDASWKLAADRGLPGAAPGAAPGATTSARQFRYWVRDHVVEMAPLDLAEAETRAVLRHGRCAKPDCRDLNRGRPKMVSKVTFMAGSYNARDDVQGWKRVWPWPAEGHNDDAGADNSMRWIIVERTLTFSLRWEGSGEAEDKT